MKVNGLHPLMIILNSFIESTENVALPNTKNCMAI